MKISEQLLKKFEDLAIDKKSKEGQMLLALIEAFVKLEIDVTENKCRLDEIDGDLAEVENEVYGETTEMAMDPDSDIFEMTCPKCNSMIYIDQDMAEDEKIMCPFCKAIIDFEIDQEDGPAPTNGGCGGQCGGCSGCN
ncbi:MAG: hypothetical protein LBM38_05835 [Clostridiales bacterium]|jgi:phage FluMu protein Com|nr:hypothetical protein [Clostridiales bacterium]